MNAPPELTWRNAALIGMLGGLCLVLLKLMQAQFYVDDPLSRQAVVAYLTYAGFLVFAAIAGVFFAEHNLRRNTFIAGLLAPSILLTFFSAPNFRVDSVGESPRAIRQLSLSLIPAAHAQLPPASSPSPIPSAELQVIHKSDVVPSFWESVRQAMGGPAAPDKYLFVIGKTADKEKALATANSLNDMKAMLNVYDDKKLPYAKVVKFDGMNDYYVTLGDLQPPAAAVHTKKVATSVGLAWLTGEAAAQAQAAAPLLVEGVVVDAKSLAGSKGWGVKQ
jgi:hypothetical protein